MNFSYSILIIEDDVSMQHILNHCLKNYSTILFNNGMDALAYLQEGHLPDIIISDLYTPVVNGTAGYRAGKIKRFF